ncbi:MAG: glucosaminidase domain-containing protein [Phascolarctobacterium sp.]|uniref:glucosaminidase domain-containing protein n=1 Tax=Phascolarctobacterium sp. TaxID=2049039 RepID=UPI0026DBA020|nr:glucosaminidase domain-containing protein [Phascolarctobacterium sp.]MDO4921279.1 glucosaminidase domain-containing protein [Phascolarctobacterium sp.]
MDYKKIVAVCVGLSFLTAVGMSGAEAKSKTAQAAQKVAAKLLKKQSKNKNKNQVTLKSGPLGGINIVTDGKKTQADKQAENADANKKTSAASASAQSGLVKKDGKVYFSGTELPENYQSISIFGEAEATKAQAVALIKANNPQVRLSCSVEELVDLYWQEAERESIRPDLALAQSVVETGFYRYGGDVQHHQNNFCGLGTTGGGVSGASFKTPEIGVRAHIQHLLAYTQKRRPKTAIVDPRYELAHNIRLERGVVDTWYGLNGTWAMGSLYCEKIMAAYQKMLAMQAEEPKDAAKREDKKEKKKKDKSAQKRGSVRERIDKILKDKK